MGAKLYYAFCKCLPQFTSTVWFFCQPKLLFFISILRQEGCSSWTGTNLACITGSWTCVYRQRRCLLWYRKTSLGTHFKFWTKHVRGLRIYCGCACPMAKWRRALNDEVVQYSIPLVIMNCFCRAGGKACLYQWSLNMYNFKFDW